MKNALLLFTEVSDRGGMEVFSKFFLDSIVSSSKDINLRIILLNNDALSLAQYRHLEFFYCRSSFKIIRKVKFVLFFFYNIIFKKPDFIISNHIWFLRLYWLISPIVKIDYGFIVYGVEAWNLNFIDRIIAKIAKVIGSFSRYTQMRIEEQIGKIGNIMLTPPTALGDEFFSKAEDSDLRDRYKLNGSKVILTVTRLASDEQYKGYDKVIQAFPKILKEIPNVKYLIVGWGDDTERAKRIVKELNLEKYVTFCGFVPNNRLVDYYNICDTFIMPSKGEGFGIVFLEALACGKPVIAGNKDGSLDPLLDGELGSLVDPDNVDEIACATIRVLKHQVPEKLLDSDFLRKKALETYGVEKFRERTIQFLGKFC